MSSVAVTEDNEVSTGSPAVLVGGSLDPVPYTTGWAMQQTILKRRLARHRRQRTTGNNNNHDDSGEEEEDHDHLLLFQHDPVYTLGRGADENNLVFLQDDDNPDNEDNRRRLDRKARGPGSARLGIDDDDDANPVLAPNGVPVYRIERGGEVTFHGPGQLVAYPLLHLKRRPYRADLHWYLRSVEEVVVGLLRDDYDVVAVRDPIHTGVWVDGDKVAAVGVSASGWITTHGFAINVDPDLDTYFDTSVLLPCGIEGRGVTSLARVLTERGDGAHVPTVEDVAAATRRSFETVFGVATR